MESPVLWVSSLSHVFVIKTRTTTVKDAQLTGEEGEGGKSKERAQECSLGLGNGRVSPMASAKFIHLNLNEL